MKKSSQNGPAGVPVSAFPDQVSVAMAEIAENMQEGLLALAQVMGRRVADRLLCDLGLS